MMTSMTQRRRYKMPLKKNNETETDMVNHPPHYKLSEQFEAIDVIEAATKDLTGYDAVSTANVLKYVLRWPNKNGLEDLKKAKWYLDHLIERKEYQNGVTKQFKDDER